MVLFNLAASGVYIINDIHDLDADRQHPMKRYRPFASGELPVRVGLFVSLILCLAALAGAFVLPGTFLAVLCAYFFLEVCRGLQGMACMERGAPV